MARSGSPYSTPRDANRVPLLVAASTADGVTPVVLEADPTTHQLQVSSTGGGGGSDVQYTDGAAAVTHPIGTIPVFNNSGTITAVSAANPLPVSATISTAGIATATKQSDGSQKTQIVDGSGNVISSTTNALDINIKSGNPTSITANAGTSLNTSLLALESGGNLAAIKADADKIPSQGQALAAASMPVVLPAAQVTTLTPPTAVGLNAGSNAIGSITNTSFAATQATAANLNATVVGTGTFVTQSTLAAETTKVIGTVNQGTSPWIINTSQINGVTPLMGNGASGTGAQRVTIASDSTGQVALAAGTALVGKVGIDQTTPGTTNAVVDTPTTAGGLSIVTGSVGATATAIKASAGQLYGYHFFNTTAAVAYVQIFNVASGSVVLGTTAPTISVGIPASGGATVNFDKGIAFSTAISFACTTTRTGSTGATCDVNFFYK